MSKYANLADALSTAITSGEYPEGSKLPTLPELCSIYRVSNTTVKKALDELETRGLVARRRGSGIYVKRVPLLGGEHPSGSSTSGQMTGLTAEYARQGKAVSSVVVEFSILHPDAKVANALAMQEEEFVYKICRVRVVDDIPRNVEYTYMPLERIPGLLERHLAGSIYAYIENDLKLKIGSAHRVLRAVSPTAQECEWLSVSAGSPLFEVRQIGYLDDGTPFEYSTTHHTSDYEFYVVSTH